MLGGTRHALSLPPTKKSLASELPKMLARRRARQKGDKDSDEAMEREREREREMVLLGSLVGLYLKLREVAVGRKLGVLLGMGTRCELLSRRASTATTYLSRNLGIRRHISTFTSLGSRSTNRRSMC